MTSADVVRAHLDAFNTGDLDRLIALFTPDVVFATGRDVVQGTVEATEFFRGALVELAPQLTVLTLVADGPLVACELGEHLELDGVVHRYSIAAFYTVDGDRLARVKVYREGVAEV